MKGFLMRIRTWLDARRSESPAVADARGRLDKANADDSTVDRLVEHRRRITRENGLARDIEQALRARRS